MIFEHMGSLVDFKIMVGNAPAAKRSRSAQTNHFIRVPAIWFTGNVSHGQGAHFRTHNKDDKLLILFSTKHACIHDDVLGMYKCMS